MSITVNTPKVRRTTRKSAKSKIVSVQIRAEVARALQAILDASETNMTVGEYMQQSVAVELLESFKVSKVSRDWTVQDGIDNTFQLEPGDMERMDLAAIKWAKQNPSALAVIESIKDSYQPIKAGTRGKVFIELDAEIVRKQRESMIAVGKTQTFEEDLEEMLADSLTVESGVFEGLIEDEDEHRRPEIEAELERIRNS